MWILPLILYILTGAIAGLLAGLLGIGGGLITVPAMHFIFRYQGFPPDKSMLLAIGTSLAAMVFTSAASSWSHYQKGGVNMGLFKKLFLGIFIGAAIGALIASSLPGRILELIFGISLVLFSISFFVPEKTKGGEAKAASRLLHFFAGLLIGTSSTILGIGGGILTVPYLTHLKIPMRGAVSTSAALGLPIACVGALSFLFLGLHQHISDASLGYLYPPGFVLIAISSTLCAPIGAKIAYAISIPLLKRVFGSALFLVGCSMIY